MDLNFEKWHGCRNDFIVLRLTEADGDIVLNSLKRQALELCDRHAGVGADGILVLWSQTKDQIVPHRLTIINSDGSIAQNCGNGLRCAASSVLKNARERHQVRETLELIDLPVEGVSKLCRFMRANQTSSLIAVEMGITVLNDELSWWDEAQSEVKKAAKELGLSKHIQDISACDVGNKHLVITCDKATRELMLELGPKLQKSPYWDGINVHIISSFTVTNKDQNRTKNELGQNLSEIYKAFVWERGAGETMACGSGAVAIGVSALQTGLIDRQSWIAVDMPGGRLYVKQEQEKDPAMLAGPATFVFRGTISI